VAGRESLFPNQRSRSQVRSERVLQHLQPICVFPALWPCPGCEGSRLKAASRPLKPWTVYTWELQGKEGKERGTGRESGDRQSGVRDRKPTQFGARGKETNTHVSTTRVNGQRGQGSAGEKQNIQRSKPTSNGQREQRSEGFGPDHCP